MSDKVKEDMEVIGADGVHVGTVPCGRQPYQAQEER